MHSKCLFFCKCTIFPALTHIEDMHDDDDMLNDCNDDLIVEGVDSFLEKVDSLSSQYIYIQVSTKYRVRTDVKSFAGQVFQLLVKLVLL